MTTGTRGRKQNALLDRLQHWGGSGHRALIRLSKGRLGNTMSGNPVIVITVTGRSSGKARETPIFGYADGDGFLSVASNGGAADFPQWFKNLQADPACWVTSRGVKNAMTAAVVSDEEKAAAWPRLVESYDAFTSYQQKTDRSIPVVRFSPR